MKRLHNTDYPTILKNLIEDQTVYPSQRFFKPVGLWYGIEDEWMSWVSCEMPDRVGKYIFELQVDLSDILIIETAEDLQQLQEKYSHPFTSTYAPVDWAKVSTDYKGIEIRNYYNLKWRSHLSISSTWVYGLDCSCGCVWDSSVIKSFYRKTTPMKWIRRLQTSL